jgi:PBP1b-binding outer membrane lipoprotein LpoB
MMRITYITLILATLTLGCSSEDKPQKTQSYQAYEEPTVSLLPDSTNIENSYAVDSTGLDKPNDIAPQTPSSEIINIRIQNSVMQTDKTIACTSDIDDGSKKMTLKAMRSSDVFELAYEGGGVFTIYFYNSDGLQATKTIYRREELETGDSQIYTSRTGEIIITLFYQ